MTREASPKLLVVSSSDDREELVAALEDAGFGSICIADGGDDTLAEAESLAPDVVVLCAGVGHGEARALASALRRGAGGPRVVLVGQRSGPVRNALDAASFEVDHFVARPLSHKALAFAVSAGVGAAPKGQSAAQKEESAAPKEESFAPEEGPAPDADGAAAGPGRPLDPPIDSIDRATDVAIDAVVREAMASLPTDPIEVPRAHGPSPAPAETAPTATAPAETVPGDADASIPELDAPDRASLRAETVPGGAGAGAGSREQPSAEGAAERNARDASPTGPFADFAPAADSAPTSAGGSAEGEGSVPHWREPTMVLSKSREREEPARADAGASPMPPEGGARASGPHADSPQRIGLDELAALDADETGAENGLRDETDDRPPGNEDADGEADDGFAGELRRKMSEMAHRLFPGYGHEASAPVDVGVAHSANTEIDLADLGVDTQVWQRDDPNLIGGELDPPPDFEDTETRERPDESAERDTGGAGDDGQVARALPARGELGAPGADVATILAHRYRGEFTGHVVFRRGEAEKRVHFVGGRPVFASSNLAHDRMGELLCREGKITREQHERCWEAVVESGRRMGEVLVELGCLKRRELLPAVRRHVEDIIYSLFAWDEGEYVAIPEDVASGETIRLSRHPAALVLEGVRRKYMQEALEARLGTSDAVVAVASRERLDEILAAADLSAAERAFVLALDGARTLGEAARDRGVELLLGYQLAFALIALGVAQLLYRGGERETEAEEARAPSLVGETDLAIDRQRVLAKRALVDDADYFALLGVRRDATGFEIRRAYESARREYAPGSFPAEVREELGGAIEEIAELLDEAYYVLGDDDLRAAYLANLRD